MHYYTLKIMVQEHDLDELRHVNNVRYLDWVQQISKAHWQHRADETMQNNFIWVVREHRIKYHSAAKLGDEIDLQTFITATNGPISTRRVVMKDNDGRLLVSAETDWCLLNPKTMRPIKMPIEIKNLFTTP